MSTPQRTPAGIRTGGQFAVSGRAESDVALPDSAATTRDGQPQPYAPIPRRSEANWAQAMMSADDDSELAKIASGHVSRSILEQVPDAKSWTVGAEFDDGRYHYDRTAVTAQKLDGTEVPIAFASDSAGIDGIQECLQDLTRLYPPTDTSSYHFADIRRRTS